MDKGPHSKFRGSLRKAKSLLKDPENLGKVFDQVDEKLKQTKGFSATVRQDYTLLLRLLKAYRDGRYQKIPWKSLVVALGALIYFLNPLDFIPDLILGAGFFDDIALLLYCLKTIHKDLEDFSAWESQTPSSLQTKKSHEGDKNISEEEG